MERSINKFLRWLGLALENLGEWLADVIANMGSDTRKTELDADFARSSDLLKRSAKGFCLDGKHCLSIEDSYKGALVFGGTGGGKTSTVLVPSALRMMGYSSLVIHDPSGEIADKVSGAFYHAGYAVRYLNYTQPELGGFNPLARIKSLSDVKKVANLIVYTSMGRSTGDPFWNMAATALLRVIIELVCNQPEEYRTMANVVRLIDMFTFKPASIDQLIVKANIPSLLAAYKSLVAYDSKLLTSITATVKAATEIFYDPEVALATA